MNPTTPSNPTSPNSAPNVQAEVRIDTPAAQAADATAKRQIAAQTEQRRIDAGSASKHEKDAPVQAGHEPQPGKLPAQQIAKPGNEWELSLAPRHQAPHYKGSEKLAGKVALITGGDSGIGRAVAVLFAREGADIAIAYLNEHEDARQTRQLVADEGRTCLLIAGDLQQEAHCQDVVRQTVEAFGRVDILVNNAAFQLHASDIGDLTEERIDLTFRTNIFAYIYMAKAITPHLQAGASIINTGSVTGMRGADELLDYAATKGAIHAFTKSLASNLIHRGIRVNAVAPGPVWTPLNPSDRPADEVAKFGQNTDMKRAAQPEEIAPAYVFLASPCCASYITGIVLPITGSVEAG